MTDGQAGRWSPEDERGAANLIDASATMRGIAAVRTGTAIPLAVPIEAGDRGPGADMRAPPQHFMTRHGGDYAAGLAEKPGYGYADDILMLPSHGVTHIDALSHVWQNGVMYNGFPATAVTSRGAAKCGIDKLGVIATRAIFLDFAGAGGPDRAADHAVTADDLIAETKRLGIAPAPGDALLIRTGWLAKWRAGRADKSRIAGLHHDCADWIADSGFAIVGADNLAVEVMPSRDPACAMPLHITLMRDRGVYLAELFDLEALEASGRHEVMLVIAPLAIRGGVGSPITPVAIL